MLEQSSFPLPPAISEFRIGVEALLCAISAHFDCKDDVVVRELV